MNRYHVTVIPMSCHCNSPRSANFRWVNAGLVAVSEARASACVSIYSRTFVNLPFRTVMAKTTAPSRSDKSTKTGAGCMVHSRTLQSRIMRLFPTWLTLTFNMRARG